jgi:hypothetical protein
VLDERATRRGVGGTRTVRQTEHESIFRTLRPRGAARERCRGIPCHGDPTLLAIDTARLVRSLSTRAALHARTGTEMAAEARTRFRGRLPPSRPGGTSSRSRLSSSNRAVRMIRGHQDEPAVAPGTPCEPTDDPGDDIIASTALSSLIRLWIPQRCGVSQGGICRMMIVASRIARRGTTVEYPQSAATNRAATDTSFYEQVCRRVDRPIGSPDCRKTIRQISSAPASPYRRRPNRWFPDRSIGPCCILQARRGAGETRASLRPAWRSR